MSSETLTLAEILALIPNYVGAIVAIAALVVSWLAYRRSTKTKSETDGVALVLAETLRELARARPFVAEQRSVLVEDAVRVTDDAQRERFDLLAARLADVAAVVRPTR